MMAVFKMADKIISDIQLPEKCKEVNYTSENISFSYWVETCKILNKKLCEERKSDSLNKEEIEK